ncbi:MAG: type II toxin-antitoxin system VapC family toxin [Rhodothermales bacterium]
MIRYLLDTNILSELVRPQPDPRVQERYRVHEQEGAIASAVWHELLYGVERLAPGRRRDALARYMTEVVQASLPVLPYDAEAAQWHARQRARLEAQGKPRPALDGMIAAVAASRGLILVTRNTGDFAGYDGLHVENWFEGGDG